MPRSPTTKPRKIAVQERSRATVDALLAATTRVLVKTGYDRASTNKIALEAGVSIGSLYQYFPTKEALVAAVIEQHLEQMMELIRSSLMRVAFMPLAEAARELVRVMIEVHRIQPKLHRVLVEQIPRIGNLEKVLLVNTQAVAMVRAYLDAHKEEVGVADLDMAALLAVSAVESLTHFAMLQRPYLLQEDAFVDEVAAMVVRYLRGGPPCYARAT